ncbi:hypothetical protein, partial [Zhongshania sp.]|uniref:hypothetical protein n=1 Tax=Zhongshania sp. TaxID=1971902 RepID=UPI0035651994
CKLGTAKRMINKEINRRSKLEIVLLFISEISLFALSFVKKHPQANRKLTQFARLSVIWLSECSYQPAGQRDMANAPLARWRRSLYFLKQIQGPLAIGSRPNFLIQAGHRF